MLNVDVLTGPQCDKGNLTYGGNNQKFVPDICEIIELLKYKVQIVQLCDAGVKKIQK